MSFKPVKCEKCGFYKTNKNRHIHHKKCKAVTSKQQSKAMPEKERLSQYEARYQIGGCT